MSVHKDRLLTATTTGRSRVYPYVTGAILHANLTLHPEHAPGLIAEATRRRMRPEQLMAELLEAVIEDDLYGAVLDR